MSPWTWFFIIIAVAFIAMHFFGHGHGHGQSGIGGHTQGNEEGRPESLTGQQAHQHDQQQKSAHRGCC